jgi:hypothetical protein
MSNQRKILNFLALTVKTVNYFFSAFQIFTANFRLTRVNQMSSVIYILIFIR